MDVRPDPSGLDRLEDGDYGMRAIRIQPSSFIDNLWEEHVGTKLPYPFTAGEDGMVAGQDFWQGSVVRVIGFQKDLHNHSLDLPWGAAFDDPQKAVGMYLVTSDKNGDWGVHDTAVMSMTVLGEENTP